MQHGVDWTVSCAGNAGPAGPVGPFGAPGAPGSPGGQGSAGQQVPKEYQGIPATEVHLVPRALQVLRVRMVPMVNLVNLEITVNLGSQVPKDQ